LTANTLIALKEEKEVADRAKTAYAAAQVFASQAEAETEAVRRELKRSWELEAELKSARESLT